MTHSLRLLPNALTWARIALAPLVVAAAAGAVFGCGDLLGDACPSTATFHAIAFILFAATGLLDVVDGWSARLLGAESEYGRMLDPVADKIATGAGLLVALTFGAPGLSGAAFLAPATIILGRDSLVNGMRADAARRGRDIPPSRLAKAKTALEFVALAVVIGAPLAPNAEKTAWIGYGLLWAAAFMAAGTGAVYFASDLRARRRSPPGTASR